MEPRIRRVVTLDGMPDSTIQHVCRRIVRFGEIHIQRCQRQRSLEAASETSGAFISSSAISFGRESKAAKLGVFEKALSMVTAAASN